MFDKQDTPNGTTVCLHLEIVANELASIVFKYFKS